MSQVKIYQSEINQIEVSVQFDKETVWLNRHQLALLFDRDIKTIGKHINNVFKEGELSEAATVAKYATVQKEGNREVKRNIEHYNLDVIISVGYRVKSKQGTQFRIWATNVLREYLVKGYAINEKRLAQKEQEVQYLKTGIRILGRAIEENTDEVNSDMLQLFAKGLALLDDYDHETLDRKGTVIDKIKYPTEAAYFSMIKEMYSDFESDVFAKAKDESFNSSIHQIKQSFGGVELYPSLEEKAANLLYLIVKNHSFVDGNKRIAAACFLYFLEQNNFLIINGKLIISNEALATLTLFIAVSKAGEHETVKHLIISILNRNKNDR